MCFNERKVLCIQREGRCGVLPSFCGGLVTAPAVALSKRATVKTTPASNTGDGVTLIKRGVKHSGGRSQRCPLTPILFFFCAMTEKAIATASELKDGEMKQVSVGGTEVLLARVGGEFHAVYAYCSHYGAPLAEGVLSGERVVCPWHHACFRPAGGSNEAPRPPRGGSPGAARCARWP